MAQRDRRYPRLVSVGRRRWCAIIFSFEGQVAKRKLIASFLFNRAVTESKRQRRGFGTKQSINKQPAQSKRVHWRRAFLVIVEVDVDIAISALPKNNRLAPGTQRCG